MNNQDKSQLVNFYDFETKILRQIPESELAPGCVLSQIEGIGEAFTKPTPDFLYKNRPLRHHPFEGEKKLLMTTFSEGFREVLPMSAEEWEIGFRKDKNVEREIGFWVSILDAYRHFSQGIERV